LPILLTGAVKKSLPASMENQIEGVIKVWLKQAKNRQSKSVWEQDSTEENSSDALNGVLTG